MGTTDIFHKTRLDLGFGGCPCCDPPLRVIKRTQRRITRRVMKERLRKGDWG